MEILTRRARKKLLKIAADYLYERYRLKNIAMYIGGIDFSYNFTYDPALSSAFEVKDDTGSQ